ncbi:thermonuclease family protein [candidate division KSB1 bacterium]|nr:thermonuclease family protein [candidate division KSB1 bacterium]
MKTKFWTIFVVIPMLLSLNSPVLAQFIPSFQHEFFGKVIRIIDADTFQVVRTDSAYQTSEYRDYVMESLGGRMKYFQDTVIVVLSEIDCPEKNQAYGDTVKNLVSKICLNKEISFNEQDQFLSDHLIGEVIVLPAGIHLNRALISAGLAWCDTTRFLIRDRRMPEMEQAARKQKLGLWQDEQPIPPWKFRAKVKK